jgi:hypothetical protein
MRNTDGGLTTGVDGLSISVLVVACAIAAFSARAYAGGWNDGSRLAAVESLIDYRTWAIDNSIFVRGTDSSTGLSPYSAPDRALRSFGTRDKMWINGQFYSDKAPVPTLYLALVYSALRRFTGLTARLQPNWFCYWMTLASSGLAYVVSVCAIERLAVAHRLTNKARILVTASFGLATIALPYARQVNSHILLLAVCSVLFCFIARNGKLSRRHLIGIGSLAGIGYTLDFAIGSVIVLGAVALTITQTRAWAAATLLLAAAFPWFVIHHVLNYRIGGMFLPANTNPEYFKWPRSPFTPESLTGGWHHDSVYKFIGYALDLLVGTRGFLGHNLPLLLAMAGAVWLLRRPDRETSAAWFAIGISICSWLVYAASSNNHGGLSCSVRWFVPLLAPGYYLLILRLRDEPAALSELKILSAGGVVLGAFMWWQGPWMPHMVPGYWIVVVVTCITWAAYCIHLRRADLRRS